MSTVPVGVTPIVSALSPGAAGRFLFLFDFDGTLTEFAPTPATASFPPARRDLLASLAARPGATVGVVSGRRLADVRSRVGLGSPLYFAGLHGMEIEGGSGRFQHEGLREAVPVIAEVTRLAEQAVAGLAGIVVEDKGYSVVLHTRLAAPSVKATATRALHAVVAPFEQRGAVRVQHGHEMAEVLPNVAWNKGDAVRWIQRRVADHAGGAAQTMYVGDDLTDEDAFRALAPEDVTVVVGSRPSSARFRLPDPAAVEALVRMLATMPSVPSL